MESKSLEDRVVLLENELQALRDLPARVGALEEQLVQFRGEVRAEFSALRSDVRNVDKRLDLSVSRLDRLDFSVLRLDKRFNGLSEKFDGLSEKFDGLSEEMHALHRVAMAEAHTLHERSLSQTRMLHEQVMSAIKLLDRG